MTRWFEAAWDTVTRSFDIQRPTKPRLFVDVSQLVRRDAGTGIQRVTRAVLLTLLKNPPAGYDVAAVYARPNAPGYFFARRFTRHLLKQPAKGVRDRRVTGRAGDIFFGLDLQQEIVANRVDDLIVLQKSGARLIFYVHDLLPIGLRQHFTPADTALHEAWLDAIARFDGAICASRSTAEDLLAWLQENGPQRDRPFGIAWSYASGELAASAPTFGMPNEAGIVLDRLNQAPTFLMVGTIEPRKGHRQTLSAFEALWSKGLEANLVLVGRRGWMMDDFIEILKSHPQQGKMLFWLDGISDEYLDKVYAASTCLIAASEGEGFGLPLIEAARHDLPILARDLAVFREVAGDHAAYFKGMAPDDLAQAVTGWLERYHAGTHPTPSGMRLITWQESVDTLVDIILNERWTHTWEPGGDKDTAPTDPRDH